MFQVEVTENGDTYRPLSLRNYSDWADAERARDSFLTDSPWATAEIVPQVRSGETS